MFYVHKKCEISDLQISQGNAAHTKRVADELIWVLLEIYRPSQHGKNFANRSRIDKVIAMVRVAHFYDSRCKSIFINALKHSVFGCVRP